MSGVSQPIEDRTQEGRKHIFVINGAPEFLNLMREVFQDERYNVTTTNFVPRSFEQIEAQQPDAIILDLVVGQQAGWNLLARLHDEATTTGIPVLAVSTDPQLLEHAGAGRALRHPVLPHQAIRPDRSAGEDAHHGWRRVAQRCGGHRALRP